MNKTPTELKDEYNNRIDLLIEKLEFIKIEKELSLMDIAKLETYNIPEIKVNKENLMVEYSMYLEQSLSKK